MSHLSLRARWIVTESGPPLRDGVVTIAGERIVAVGQSASDKTHDLGDVVLLPGLVNAHTHLEFSDCRQPLCRAATPLPVWIRQVIGIRHRTDRDAAAAVSQGMRESLQAGVTAIAEISTLSPSSYAGFAGSHPQHFRR
jgi:cytosine/adenosine deaminase-related metal-dependent hydrolase